MFSDNEYMMHQLFLSGGTDPKLADLLKPVLLETFPISLS